jgi:hypothetical protein
MDQEDKYNYFLIKAILNIDTTILYLYDKKSDTLFRIKKEGDVWKPTFFNENLKNELYLKQEKEVTDLIHDFNNKETSIAELKKVSDLEKKNFLEDYIESIDDGFLKERLKTELKYYDLFPGNEKIVGKLLKSNHLGISYSHRVWLFLEVTFKKSYYPLGMSLESEVYF